MEAAHIRNAARLEQLLHRGWPTAAHVGIDSGELSSLLICDADGVDDRRSEVGLGPLTEQIAHQRSQAIASDERPPADSATARGIRDVASPRGLGCVIG
ncbi:hypothetical protein BMW24_001920 [Mycobacterium heckeshornense]|nr:hypothetical protein [Mycobacterium heckeshornense]KMV24495.1 hypothetical protein ACT16_01060 [Mycobacterium heckeshornense]MCV7035571.1 hypothetical protein [Mycobacterium heckeshornense]PIJ37875.1 hypothetical protein BMW24_001920 [Mycobacterium heckeshornense]